MSRSLNNQTAAKKPESTTIDFLDIRDGEKYRLIYLGDQVWFGKNLNYDTSTDDACYNNLDENCNTDGRLYKWTIAQDICPIGWKLPSRTDFEELLNIVNFDKDNVLRVGGSSSFELKRSGVVSIYQFNGENRLVFNGKGELTNLWTSSIDESDDKAFIFTYPGSSQGFFLKLTREDYAFIRCLKE